MPNFKTIQWKCFPPLISAYNTPDYPVLRKTPSEHRDDLEKSMRTMALRWGMESLGEQVMHNAPLGLKHQVILCLGYIENEGYRAKYAIRVRTEHRDDWTNYLEMIALDWDDSLDKT
jgi:hypothetical protein